MRFHWNIKEGRLISGMAMHRRAGQLTGLAAQIGVISACLVAPAGGQTVPPTARMGFASPASMETAEERGVAGGYLRLAGNASGPQQALSEPIEGPFTLSAFIRADEFPNEGEKGFSDVSPAAIVSLDAAEGGDRSFLRVLQGRLQFAVSMDGQWYSTTSTRPLPTGRWVHVAGVWDGRRLKVIVDGFVDGSKVAPAGSGHGAFTEMKAGAADANKRFWRGDLDEVAVFDHAMDGPAVWESLGVAWRVSRPRVALSDISDRPFPPRPALRVGDDVVHPLVDSGGAHVTFVPWSGPDSLEMISIGHPSLYGSRSALLRVVGEDDSAWSAGEGFPLYDQGQTLPFPGQQIECVARPDGLFDLVAFGRGAAFGEVYLSWYRNSGTPGEPVFEAAEPVGPNDQSLIDAAADDVNDVSVGDLDGDGVPDLMVVTREPLTEYFPGNESFWSRRPHPDAGPGRGFDIAGHWLGDRMTARVYWAPGRWDDAARLSFGGLRPVYLGDRDFQVQWRTHGFFISAAAAELDGERYLLLFGDVDEVYALPARRDGENVRCGAAQPLLAGGATLDAAYFSSQFAFADLDGDGRTEIVLCGNTGRPVVLRGERPGDFREVGTLNQRGGYVAVDTLAVPCRVDWDRDGREDLIVGDASGRLWFWPGTDDPATYGAPAYFRLDGEPFRRVAGETGSIQGPSEAGWGYLQPTAGDWAGDGSMAIITNDIRGELMLYHAASPGSLDLVGEPITLGGAPLPAAWRTRPAIVSHDGQPALLYMDGDGDVALAVPASPGAARIAQTVKPRDPAGEPFHLCGPAGHFGRIKFAATDWDADGRWDILFGTASGNYRYFMPPDRVPPGAAPGLMRQLDADDGLTFSPPVILRGRNDEPIDLGHHVCAVWPTHLDDDGRIDLIAGSEDGKVYPLRRSEMALDPPSSLDKE